MYYLIYTITHCRCRSLYSPHYIIIQYLCRANGESRVRKKVNNSHMLPSSTADIIYLIIIWNKRQPTNQPLSIFTFKCVGICVIVDIKFKLMKANLKIFAFLDLGSTKVQQSPIQLVSICWFYSNSNRFRS